MNTIRFHTDQELLEAISHDDESAFNELVRRYWKRVHIMTYARVRSKETTEEIVQELFTSLWDKRAKCTIKNLPSYLYQAVKFKSLNHFESKIVKEKYRARYRRLVLQKENIADKTVEYLDLVEAIEKGMTELPEKSKKVFKLHRMEGWSVPEIASLLNLSEKAIQYHLTQSVKRLRVHLLNHFVTLAIPWMLAVAGG